MSDTLTAHYRVTFANTIALLLQQKESRLRGLVMNGSYKGKAASVVDQYGVTEAQDRDGRYTPKTPVRTPVDRRWVYPFPADWMDLIDDFDKLQVILDPQSGLMMSCMAAMNRKIDDRIIKNFFADAPTGEQGATPVTWAAFIAANAGNQVSVNVGGAVSGLNVAKLRAARKVLLQAEVDLESDPITCIATATQLDNLLNEAQVVSTDFNEKPILKEGKIERFLGINFLHSERTQLDANGYRRVPIFAKSGMHLGIWSDISTDVSQRKDLKGDPYQISADLTIGATRTEEKKLVEVLCSEA